MEIAELGANFAKTIRFDVENMVHVVGGLNSHHDHVQVHCQYKILGDMFDPWFHGWFPTYLSSVC
jgi:hypothetical protein